MDWATLLSVEAGPPRGDEAPSAPELFSIGVMGLDLGRAGRATLMNRIGSILKVPPGGWAHGLSRLFADGDIRLLGLLRRLAKKEDAIAVANNLSRARHLTSGNIMLALVTAAREYHRALTASSTRLVNSYYQGGLDFLWDNKKKLGLPREIVDAWKRVTPFISHETGHEVHPAEIPARDQMLVYAAQIDASFEGSFKHNARNVIGSGADLALAQASRVGLLVWRAYSFLAPGGRPFDTKRTVAAQSGQPFGSRTAMSFIAQVARKKDPAAIVDLDQILNDVNLNQVEWVRIAKARVLGCFLNDCS